MANKLPHAPCRCNAGGDRATSRHEHERQRVPTLYAPPHSTHSPPDEALAGPGGELVERSRRRAGEECMKEEERDERMEDEEKRMEEEKEEEEQRREECMEERKGMGGW